MLLAVRDPPTLLPHSSLSSSLLPRAPIMHTLPLGTQRPVHTAEAPVALAGQQLHPLCGPLVGT